MCRALAGFAAVDAGEVPRAHMRHGGQGRNRQVAGEILGDPSMEVIEATPRVARLASQLDAELRLTARSFQEKDQQPRESKRGRVPEIIFYHGECHIDPGGHAGGRPDPVQYYVYGVGFDAHRGVIALKLTTGLPMCRRLTTVENAKFRQDESADANRADPAWAPEMIGQAVSHRCRGSRRSIRVATGHEQRIDFALQCLR